MLKRGFVHLIPLFAVAVLLVGVVSVVSVDLENAQKKAVGKVLSDRSENGEQEERHEEEESGNGDDSQGRSESESKSSGEPAEVKSGPVKVESKTDKFESEFESEGNKSKIKIKNINGEFESETENGKTETKFEGLGYKIEVKVENGRLVVKAKDKDGREVELDDEEEDELIEEAENELEDDGIRLATGSAEVGFIENGRKVRTNFPLSVDPATGELYVTTPAGTKVVAILPSVAIENMIKAGILTRISEDGPAPTPTPGEGTESADATQGAVLSVLESPIELAEEDGEPVYEITGVRDEKLAGFVPVEIKLTTVVSAGDGSLVDVRQGLFARILDLISF